ncbi:MAG: response regulator [Clostridiales bacterium]|jgi:two-component system response regulator YesN|nr:response regulator [Clostridiales bacterium]
MLAKVLIVDDEVVFRSHLRNMLDWERHGFQICGEADAVSSAKRKIAQLKPDIVITDICMPDGDGLSLISFIREGYPLTGVIALSGYDNYEYVRNSLKNGVCDYLLKHLVDESSLLSALSLAFPSEKLPKDGLPSLQNERGAKKQALLDKLLKGEDLDNLEPEFEKLGIPFPKQCSAVVIVAIDEMSRHKEQYGGKWEIMFNKINEVAEEIMNKAIDGVVAPKGDDKLALVFCPDAKHSSATLHTVINDTISKLRQALKMHCNVTACYAIGDIAPSADQVSSSYSTAEALITERVYLGFDRIILTKTKEQQVSDPEMYNISFEDERSIIKSFEAGDSAGIRNIIGKIFEDRRKMRLDISKLQIVLAELLNILHWQLRENKMGDLAEIYPSYHKIFGNIQYMSLDEMMKCVADCYQKALDAVANIGVQDDFHTVTNQACVYINRHFASNISLNDIAEAVGVTPAYLSRVFKKDKRQTVVEHLNCIRVERAKKLLRERRVSFNELAELVGFNSNTYFFTVFKKYTGKTPSDYKKSLDGQREGEFGEVDAKSKVERIADRAQSS